VPPPQHRRKRSCSETQHSMVVRLVVLLALGDIAKLLEPKISFNFFLFERSRRRCSQSFSKPLEGFLSAISRETVPRPDEYCIQPHAVLKSASD
jgi:hypothetical protein